MMEDIELSEKESLALITSMINRAKNRFSETGFMYLLWGWAVLICSVAQFISVTVLKIQNGYLVWLLLWLIAAYQIFYYKMRKRRDVVHTYTEEISGYVWISALCAMVVSIFICIQLGRPELITPIMLMLYGIPITISGAILQFRPLVAGGIACWVLAAVSPFIREEYRVLLISAAIIAAWIIPGYKLKSRYRNETES